ncbi:MAG TPA: PVC-type heme-binding CxxCH protein [Isosphaeraceae bacterium]|jgi:putative membrane-bound dehydrogenase-like protein|nr:PVC-type heme-binding CxxCH protein [Isosphaeraceae bacterium]
MKLRLASLLACVATLFICVQAEAADPTEAAVNRGFVPTGASGKGLNFDFEAGTLKDWKAEGDAFARQPIEGDTVQKRRSDMKSGHAGRYWVGTFEAAGDQVKGTLTSVKFKVTQPWASFLVGGGSHPETCVEIVREDTNEVIFRASGDNNEEMNRAVVDLTKHIGRDVVIRVVDQASGHWGHINFDDFRFHEARPSFSTRLVAPAPDVLANEGLTPVDAAKAMTVPPGFKVTLFAGEPDVVQPIAFAIDDRGRLWVAEAYSYPHRVAADHAKDRILIFEDADGDGHFDKRTVFADKLNLVSGLEVGFGGVWVGAAPEFLFIPDKNGDDKPDGPPQLMLDGWGQHDTHETLNSFTWGPDGWLYGCHGVFTHSNVGKPGTPDAERLPLNGGIWRYHPTRHLFEVFAHGTSNPWGVDFDKHGQAFLTSCVIPHLYHVIQAARYERQAGQHFNPYTYDDIKTIADHRHWIGATPHAGNGRSDAAGGGHAHAGALIYNSEAWPQEYRGSIFMNNIHGARLNRDSLTPRGSGFVGSHAPDFLLANDSWSQIVSLREGPDGSVYMIDWYDKNQCHRTEAEMHDRTNGRIFKITYGSPEQERVDLKKLDNGELIELLSSTSQWRASHARRILQERYALGPKPGPNTEKNIALGAFRGDNELVRLRHLWALHVTAGLGDVGLARALEDQSPYVRAWAIQFATEVDAPSLTTVMKLADMALNDPSPVVRLYLASALQRLPLEKRWDILAGLVQRAEDADDPNLPLMYWYGAEPLAAADVDRALRLAAGSRVPPLFSFMSRRIGAIGTPAAIARLVEELRASERPGARLILLEGINQGLKGRRSVDMPAAWRDVAAQLGRDNDPKVRSQAQALGVTFGDPAALDAMRRVLTDSQAAVDDRQEALAALLKARDPKLAGSLQALVADTALRASAIRSLAVYDDSRTPEVLLRAYGDLPPGERRDALNTLSSRVEFARPLLEAVGAKRVPSSDLSADLIRQLRNLKDDALSDQISRVWGTVRETTEDKAKLIARYKTMITRPYGPPRDVNLGRAIFAKTCQQCHTLFGTGAKVGPEITGSNRVDLDYLLSNILDPSALIGRDYLTHVVATHDGRTLTGLIRSEDKDSITLVTANETLIVPQAEIDERRPSDKSMMPEDLLGPLSEPEIRALVVYLASPSQVPMLATRDNARDFFNGRDLTGWQGDPKLWTVENGEIVGKTAGLARNEFLRSEMMAGDFRLTCQVKLVGNEGNSGIQFRSAALPEGEMKGDQADIGVGWWGKLYEENGRGLLWDQSGEAHVKPNDWNTYEILAIGTKIRTRINGKICVDLDDPAGAPRGIFAFQLHSGGPTEVRFRDLKLEVAPIPGQ